jgi:hypothetical protein
MHSERASFGDETQIMQSDDGCITFKALATEPDYMQDSNPDGPAMIYHSEKGFLCKKDGNRKCQA